MSSYAIIGASRGIGLGWVRYLSKDKDNKVFAIVRSPSTAVKLAPLAEASPNVHVIQGDLDDVASLKNAATEVGKITGGSLDYLINNGAVIHAKHSNRTIVDYPDEISLEEDLFTSFRTNVVGVTHATNAFLPLLRKGTAKVIVGISSGAGSTEFVIASGSGSNVPYGISKAALNMAIAKIAAALKPEGFTVISLSPGCVDNWSNDPEENPDPLPELLKALLPMFQKYAPYWDGVPLSPMQSVEMMMDVIRKLGPEDSGAFLSHHGNQQWF